MLSVTNMIKSTNITYYSTWVVTIIHHIYQIRVYPFLPKMRWSDSFTVLKLIIIIFFSSDYYNIFLHIVVKKKKNDKMFIITIGLIMFSVSQNITFFFFFGLSFFFKKIIQSLKNYFHILFNIFLITFLFLKNLQSSHYSFKNCYLSNKVFVQIEGA